jgi:hypothetical protein
MACFCAGFPTTFWPELWITPRRPKEIVQSGEPLVPVQLYIPGCLLTQTLALKFCKGQKGTQFVTLTKLA